ncbi:DNA-directed RNA polymerase subunit alpha [Candidatus Falkowbacteria bacterium CG10_big_fil_rev_8_21_14_0_10_37_14]|uniref:DNA-directed RNA polymerase subunit alpha n=1 Tax=Candidatus Falkowbacteria bacterium CG10_big_fil_rev_8_21_14_0_10_37_14 TaxID=1974561 RepID=A0A2M6WSK8_9BACT|nr:DNA-directed RNA polymerase subunit alpha [Candidatus Falkowbacteria bacterium]PIT95752.1 MAG: DNA-directed RNA polymerase subunit alpha [Candidatus Falkowbacteria bacterium CG10_big_fil_rev_8_21_14_0_10_37_14]
MNNIALPKKIEFQAGDKPFQKIVTIEPMYPGYGITLGNSLRRVLLSSLPGAAVIGVKIAGADHEFMALPNVKEDVLELILNLKQLHLKIHSDETVCLRLEAKGEKTVTAADFEKNSDVEVMNPKLVLGHITDMAGNLSMEVYATKGLGYETLETREDRKKELGYMEIDSIFSPVRYVGINVENTRVGKMTNWDKLTLDIITNGTIEPEEAFRQAVDILVSQFRALAPKSADTSLEEDKE